jgi:hypothetical protein
MGGQPWPELELHDRPWGGGGGRGRGGREEVKREWRHEGL